MARPQVHLKLVGGGWLEIGVKHPSIEVFHETLESMQAKMPVFQYSKKTKRYNTTLYHIDKLLEIAAKRHWDIFASEKCIRTFKRWKHKRGRRIEAKYDEEFTTELWTEEKDLQILPYQKAAINFALEGGSGLVGDDLGLGKTIVAMAVICEVCGEDGKALVVVKNNLREQWMEEFNRFTKLDPWDITIAGGREYYRCPEQYVCDGGADFRLVDSPCYDCDQKEMCKDNTRSGEKIRNNQIEQGRIVIIGYEAMRLSKDKLKGKRGNPEFDVIVFDEASKIKTRKAQVTKAAIEICNTQDAVVLPMSGTFIENSLEEMWPSMHITDSRVLGYFGDFSRYYADRDYFKQIIRYKNLGYFKKLTEPFLLRRTIDEVWEQRPPLVEVNRECQMSTHQAKLYNDAKEGVLKELADKEKEGKINFAGVLALLQYLLQIACTAEVLIGSGEKDVSCKIDELVDILRNEVDSSKQVVVFCSYPNNVSPFIKRRLIENRISVGEVSGKVKNKPKVIKQFKNGNFRVLLASEVISYGTNMQFISYVVNFNLPWNPAKLDQRIGRVYRKGQKNSVTVVNLTTIGTVDERVLEKIEEKRTLFDDVLGYGKFRKLKKPNLKDLLGLIR